MPSCTCREKMPSGWVINSQRPACCHAKQHKRKKTSKNPAAATWHTEDTETCLLPYHQIWKGEDVQRPEHHHATWASCRYLEAYFCHAMQCGQRRSPRGPPALWPACSRSHYNVKVCGWQMGEKEKWNCLNIKKRNVTGDPRVERRSLLLVASLATWGHGDIPAHVAIKCHV